MSVKIHSFGNGVICGSLEMLKSTLKFRHTGQHISLEELTSNPVFHATFVTVNENGDCQNSYSDENLVYRS